MRQAAQGSEESPVCRRHSHTCPSFIKPEPRLTGLPQLAFCGSGYFNHPDHRPCIRPATEGGLYWPWLPGWETGLLVVPFPGAPTEADLNRRSPGFHPGALTTELSVRATLLSGSSDSYRTTSTLLSA